MDKKLAIKGHLKRGKEVIKTLEMLGGKESVLGGCNANYIYYIDTNSNCIIVKDINNCDPNEFTIFTLEEFLEKYPYKVGDKVQEKGSAHCDSVYIIESIIWEKDHIDYVAYNQHHEYPKCTVTAECLQPYKKNTHTPPGITINGENLIVPNGYTIKTATANGNSIIVEYVKNKPQYPKTYEECCKILGADPNKKIVLSNSEDAIPEENEHCYELYNLYRLLICRDAYWKIAGEKMGLGRSWKPIWGPNLPVNYVIRKVNHTDIIKPSGNVDSEILAFPTKEMRDEFFENFRDLIEKCVKFL